MECKHKYDNLGLVMKISQEKIDEAMLFFKKKKTFTVKNVVSRLGYSIPTVRLKLRQWEARSSYNRSGQYYALPDVPRFDENGLWWHHRLVLKPKQLVVILPAICRSGGRVLGEHVSR